MPSAAWPASRRFGVAPAPGGLALVQDFLNSHGSADVGPDLLVDTAGAQAWADAAVGTWSAQTGRTCAGPGLSARDVIKLRELRRTLETELRPERVFGPRVWSAEIELVFEMGGTRWRPAGSGWRWLASVILTEMLASQLAGTWPRMKQCPNNSCRATYYDRSWDNRAIWHNIRTCRPADGPDDRVRR